MEMLFIIVLKKNKEETKELLHLIKGGLNKFIVVFSNIRSKLDSINCPIPRPSKALTSQ